MSKHKHYWDATDLPGRFICICGANRHYLRDQQAYCVHDNEDDSIHRIEKVSA